MSYAFDAKHSVYHILVIGTLVTGGIGLTSRALAEHGIASQTTKSMVDSTDSHRIIKGIVEEITEDQIKVDAGESGEMSPRYLSLNIAQEKGFSLEKGDKIEIVVNAQNLVVDYRLVNRND